MSQENETIRDREHTKEYDVRLDIATACGACADFAIVYSLANHIQGYLPPTTDAVSSVKITCTMHTLLVLTFRLRRLALLVE